VRERGFALRVASTHGRVLALVSSQTRAGR
jgi:hypothetical protein